MNRDDMTRNLGLIGEKIVINHYSRLGGIVEHSINSYDNKKDLVVDGKTVYQTVSYYRNTTLRNPIAGATGTWSSHFNPASQLTLFAVPTK